MKSYRINYIDGHDLRYKSVEVQAETEESALSALWDMYDADYDHQIVEGIETGGASSANMRIGSTTLATPPFTQESRQYLEVHYV